MGLFLNQHELHTLTWREPLWDVDIGVSTSADGKKQMEKISVILRRNIEGGQKAEEIQRERKGKER